MAELANWQDVQSRLLGRVLTVPEQDTITVWIVDLESDIRRRIPNVDAQVVADPNFGNIIKRVISAVVKRVLDNPKGLRQSTVSIDDYSRTETVDTTGSSGVLGFSDDDWAALLPITSGDAWTITPYGAP